MRLGAIDRSGKHASAVATTTVRSSERSTARRGRRARTWARTRVPHTGRPAEAHTSRGATGPQPVAWHPTGGSRRDRACQCVGDGRPGDHGIRLWCQPSHPAQGARSRRTEETHARPDWCPRGFRRAVRRAHRREFHDQVDTTAERVGEPWCRLDHAPRAFRWVLCCLCGRSSRGRYRAVPRRAMALRSAGPSGCLCSELPGALWGWRGRRWLERSLPGLNPAMPCRPRRPASDGAEHRRF